MPQVERVYPKARSECHVYRRLRAAVYTVLADLTAKEMGLGINEIHGGLMMAEDEYFRMVGPKPISRVEPEVRA